MPSGEPLVVHFLYRSANQAAPCRTPLPQKKADGCATLNSVDQRSDWTVYATIFALFTIIAGDAAESGRLVRKPSFRRLQSGIHLLVMVSATCLATACDDDSVGNLISAESGTGTFRFRHRRAGSAAHQRYPDHQF